MRNLEPILIFITVAEMGSFTHAAESLGIQKGRASTAVRKLEEDVGVRLLHRSTRSYEAAALAGLGLIQAPLLGIGRYLESGALVEILPDFHRRSLAVSLDGGCTTSRPRFRQQERYCGRR